MTQMESSSREVIAGYYSQHFDELCGYIRNRLSTDWNVEDIAQDVFLKLLRSGKTILPQTLPALVYRMAHNKIIDEQRKLQSYVGYSNHCRWEGEQYDEAGSVYAMLEIHEWVERGLARLSEKECRIYRIHFYEGMQVKEIAQVTQMKYKTVEVNLMKARKKMRAYLSPLAV